MLTLKYGSYTFTGATPDISLSTSIDTTPAGSPIGSTISINIKGVIFAGGELNNNSNYLVSNNLGYYAFTGLLSIITGMKDAFSKDYQNLELKCNNTKILPDDIQPGTVHVDSINFSPTSSDPNILRSIEYNIALTAYSTGMMNYISGFTPGVYVSSIQNSYTIESLDTLNYYGYTDSTSKTMYPTLSGEYLPTYRLTRTLGATGKDGPGGSLSNAKKCVSGLIEQDTAFWDVISNLTLFERSSSVDIDPIAGSYAIVDTYTAISGSPPNDWTETFTINHSIDDTLKRTVTINGAIQGLGKNWSTAMEPFQHTTREQKPSYIQPRISKYKSASGAFDFIQNQMYQRIVSTVFPATTGGDKKLNYYGYKDTFSSYNGIINPIPLSMSVEHDESNGSITYNYTYDTRPISLVSGSIAENLTVEDTYGVRSYAQLSVMARRPLYQDMGTYSSSSRTASYEGSFPSTTGFLPSQTTTYINTVLDQFDPIKVKSTFISKLVKDDINTDIVNGRYSRSKTWTYQKRS